MATVYLVKDVGNSPGRIYAIFASEKDAEKFLLSLSIDNFNDSIAVVERTLFYGQPPNCGYNE
jgi:hypothetical protein